MTPRPAPHRNARAALQAARDILHNLCVCGHLDTDHFPASAARLTTCGECECGRFARQDFLTVSVTRKGMDTQ